MAANGISELATKELKQKAKLDLTSLKRQGNVLNNDGTVYSTSLGSAQFNGTNQYLTVPADPALALGTGDFTVETWVYLSSAPGEYAVIDCEGTGQFGFLINSTDIIAFASVAEAYSFTSAVSASEWHHIAFCRVGTTLTCYLDGVSVGTPATTAYNFTSLDAFTIGRNPGANSQYLNGYVSNLRIVKGQALYTNNFTPSTSTLTAVAGTQLLLLNGATEFVDGSSNQFTITNSGSVTLLTTAPTLTPATPAYRTRATYDITLLPTQFNDNDIINNANVGGLVVGRPWTTASGDAAGLFKTTYAGYAEDNVNFFATATPTTFGANPATSVQTTEIFEPNSEDGELFSVQWLGYFKPTTTETHTFYLNSDDGSYLWIGATAVTGFTTGNALINNGGAHAPVEVSGSIALTAGQYYPVRIQFGEGGGGDVLQFSYETPTIAKTTDVTGKVFYNTATNGF
jgi:hypothetical protein